MTTFIVSGMISIVLNSRFLDRVEKMTEVNILKFYTNCMHSFVFVIGMVLVVSLGVIFLEAYHRSELRDHKIHMDEKKK